MTTSANSPSQQAERMQAPTLRVEKTTKAMADLQANVRAMEKALTAIEQGYHFVGSRREDLTAEGMQEWARWGLGRPDLGDRTKRG